MKKIVLITLSAVAVTALAIFIITNQPPKTEPELPEDVLRISPEKESVNSDNRDREQSTKNKFEYKIANAKAFTLEGDYSTPIWSPDGQSIAYTTREQNGIMIMNKDGSDSRILTRDIGAGYKFTWSLDNSHIAYRGTKFENKKRTQFIGVIDVFNNTSEIISNLQNRLQPPFWNYSEKGKQVSYVLNDQVEFLKSYSYSSKEFINLFKIANVNRFLYYKERNLVLINDDSEFELATKIEGFDPVISPNRQKFIYSKWDQLHLFNFEDKTDILIGDGHHPSWSPDGSKIVYQKSKDDGHNITESDLYIMDFVNMQNRQLTNTVEVFEVNPSWSPDGKEILFNDEKSGIIYLISLN